MKNKCTTRMFKRKAVRTSDESSSQASYPFDDSNDSTPITSPSKIHSTMESEPNLTQFDYTSHWMTREMVSNASKVYYLLNIFLISCFQLSGALDTINKQFKINSQD